MRRQGGFKLEAIVSKELKSFEKDSKYREMR
jgi:hypothetical protein